MTSKVKAPATFIFGYRSANPLSITPDMQLGDATTSFSISTSELNDQSTTTAVDYVETGFNATSTFTLATVEALNVIAILSNIQPITDADGNIVLPYSDRSGCKLPRQSVAVVPAGCSSGDEGTIWMPSAVVKYSDNSQLTHSQTNQSALTFEVMAMPDPASNLKLVYGARNGFDPVLAVAA